MISEKIRLLGAGVYSDIPDELTLKSIPTTSELDYVGSEDFNSTMLEKIFPKAIEEKINFNNLFEIDYHWICRCLRFLNYGPYHNVNAIFCSDCGQTSKGDYVVDLRTIDCKPLPEGFVNDVVIKKDEFIDYGKDIHVSLLTIKDVLNAYDDKMFVSESGHINRNLARICYMMKSSGGKSLNPVTAKMIIENELSPADYIILKDRVNELTDFGLRAAGKVKCPVCGSTEAVYIALVDDRFFRPTLGALKQWRDDRSSRRDEDISGSAAEAVRKHN